VKVGAKVVRHGRYVTFQLAEVAILLPLFAEILRLIAAPRPLTPRDGFANPMDGVAQTKLKCLLVARNPADV
jgi:hypothetical protein